MIADNILSKLQKVEKFEVMDPGWLLVGCWLFSLIWSMGDTGINGTDGTSLVFVWP